ncbi:MAG: YraN family protein [Deltaproteobacteria bacterium]|nr:YraN family protein [Deltaproteobacteria bacterium]
MEHENPADHKPGKKQTGDRGEALAAVWLESKGYRLLERNFRCRLGEIDLVAAQGEYVVFVEVKSRMADTPLHPSLSVTRAKQARLRRLGEFYCLTVLKAPRQPRFDVISVWLDPSDRMAADSPETRNLLEPGNPPQGGQTNGNRGPIANSQDHTVRIRGNTLEHLMNAF